MLFDTGTRVTSICQQIWKAQLWPQDWKRSVLIPILRKGSTKEHSNHQTIAFISHASKPLLLLSRFSCVRLCVTLWTAAHQAPLSTGFSRQECWSGLPFPFPVTKCEVTEVKSLSRVRLFATPWTVAYRASPSMEFSRQEYWSGVPFPSPNSYIT